jgi:periplasmic protein TonB
MKTIKENEEQLNEIVFENRNKEYGAYALRSAYKKRILLAMSIALTAFLLAVSFPLIAGYLNKSHIINEDKTVDAELIDHTNKTAPPVIPPPPTPPVKENIDKVRLLPPTISDIDSLVGTFGVDADSVNNKPIDTTITKEIIPEDPKKNKTIIMEEKINEIWDIQEPPTFPGGDQVWMNFIASNIKYPLMAKESGTTGTVHVRFVIEPDGSISNVTSVRPLGAGCDEEAIRVVSMMPKWNPGKQNGKAVRVWFILPIKFILQ